jgi:hypothetical protein
MTFLCQVPKGWECDFYRTAVPEIPSWAWVPTVVGPMVIVIVAVVVCLAAWYVAKWIDAKTW